jgi:CHAT domain-containing protein
VLHFACHGSANPAEPLASALDLARDRKLTLRDVMGQRLPRARLAILSACESAVPGAALPDEVIGLPTGFIEAGAAVVIGSLWVVPDLSTMVLMACCYELWQRKRLEPAEALRQAQQWLRDSTKDEKARWFPDTAVDLERMPARMLQAPDHWAAFAYVGT